MAEKTHDQPKEPVVLQPQADPMLSNNVKRDENISDVTSDHSHVRRSINGAAPVLPSSDAVALLYQSAFRSSRYDNPRKDIIGKLQQQYGNKSVQRLIASITFKSRGGPDSESRLKKSHEGKPSAVNNLEVEQYIEKSRGHGQSMDSNTLEQMNTDFGRDFSGVRLHTGSSAGNAARTLGAGAFTTGRDIYFGPGRYQPGSRSGRHLLAHELAHTVQQGNAPSSPKAKLVVGSAHDPQEKEADAVADHIVYGTAQTKASAGARDSIVLQRQETETAPPPPASEPPEAVTEGDLLIKLGKSIRISAEEIAGSGRSITVDLTKKPITVPGLRLNRFVYRPKNKKGEVRADLNIPFASNLQGGVRFGVDKDGRTTLDAKAKLPVKIGALNNPKMDLMLDDTNNLSAKLTINASKLAPRGLPNLSVGGGGEVSMNNGKLGGSVNANLDYKGLAKGGFKLDFKDGVPTGGGNVNITQEFLKGASAGLQIENGDLKADVTVPANKIAPPIPGLEVPDGTIQIIMHNGVMSGTISGLRLRYKELGEGTLNGSISKDRAVGSGDFTVNIPALDPVTGKLGYKGGKFFGFATVSSTQFPESLPVNRGNITAGIDETGAVNFKGGVGVEFAGVGRGEIRGAYEKGKLALGADINLSIPGLDSVAARVDYINGELEGELDIPINSKKLAGISGQLHVEYREKKWKAEQKIGYERDNGKLKGNVTLGVMQDDKNALVLYGGGNVTAQLTDFLTGQLKLDILPEGTTKVFGAITVTEPIELFPEKKVDKELFSIRRNIPLWAILVAVIRLRSGVRAGVGPGQLRDIKVEGEYTIGEETQPSFVINGELFIPAFAEAYIAFGAGLGLDVLLGSLTGGIEAIGMAGVYGAVSVMPEIAYRDGNYSISGVATMAGAAKIKLGLQAWAEIEALWVTVWENTWHLAEWVWDVGPTLALQANMEYVFGQPKPPSFEFKTSDIDAEKLIQDAMPKDGPKGSGAKEAMKNRAEWKGRTKAKGKEADKVPAESAAKETKAPAPKAPPKPPQKAKPTGDGPAPRRPIKEKGGKRTPELEKTIDKAAKDKAKEKAKESAGPGNAPVFPKPTSHQIEINWANYLKDKSGKRTIERKVFEDRMRAGEVYHPKNNRWQSISEDYQRAYDSMKEADRNPVNFADKIRSGYFIGSPPRPDPQWDSSLTVPVPDASGSEKKPFSIHWPRKFLVSTFETFTVSGGQRIPPDGDKQYSFTVGGRKQSFSFGVSSKFNDMMGLGKKLKRQGPDRTSGRTAAAWRDWDAVGFKGHTGGGPVVGDYPFKPDRVSVGDESMFLRHENPYTGTALEELTFKQYLEKDNTPRAFSHYAKASPSKQEKLRTAARNKEIDLRNQSGDVKRFLEWYRADQTVKASMRGHAGYEMQHAIPLFLAGSSADVRENMWPLTIQQHRAEGHSILANQSHLKSKYNLPTHDLESPLLNNYWFQIVKHGSSI